MGQTLRLRSKELSSLTILQEDLSSSMFGGLEAPAVADRLLLVSDSMAHPQYLLRFTVLEGTCLLITPTAATCTIQWYRQLITHIHHRRFMAPHHITRRTMGHLHRTHRCTACTLWAALSVYR